MPWPRPVAVLALLTCTTLACRRGQNTVATDASVDSNAIASASASAMPPRASESADAGPYPDFVPEPYRGEDRFGNLPHPRVVPPFKGTAVDFELGALAETVPPAHTLDGVISEWAGPASATLTTSSGRGSAWLALTDQGLVVAGSIDAATSRDGVILDKVRIQLGFTAPQMPPIAFVSHLFADQVDEKWCRTKAVNQFDEKATVQPTQVKDCLDWLERCVQLRAAIAERFERTIVVDLAKRTVTRADGSGGVRGVVQPADAAGRISFEVSLAATAFPETSEYPLRNVRIGLRAYSERGAARGGATSGVASAKSFVLAQPLRLFRAPELLSRIVARAATPGRDELMNVSVSYVPAPTSSHVNFYYNRGMAGQWAPELPSPQLTDIDVTKGRTLFTLPACAADTAALCGGPGVITIAAHPGWVDEGHWPGHHQVALVSRVGDAVLDVSEFSSSDPYTLVKRTPGVHVLSVYQGPAGPYGSGPSGMMRAYSFTVTTMSRDGTFAAIVDPKFEIAVVRDRLLGVELMPGFEKQSSMNGADLVIDPTLKSFGLRGSLSLSSDGADADYDSLQRDFDVGYRWDASSGRYVAFGKTLKPKTPVP